MDAYVEGNGLDFEVMSEEEVAIINEQSNSCMPIAQVAQEAMESNLEAEYFYFERILSPSPKQLITTPTTTTTPAVLTDWPFILTYYGLMVQTVTF